MVKAGIIGATGYAGAELCRMLQYHKKVELKAISSHSFEGQMLPEIYQAYQSIIELKCQTQEDVIEKADVIFAALPHGHSQEIAKICKEKSKVFIDLGADFRLDSEADYKKWYGCDFMDIDLQEEAVYGLPELYRNRIKGSTLIANPGCYTTAVPLALYPALVSNLIETKGIICDCKSGVTGAGRGLSQATHFADLNEGFSAYKVANHRHTPEIEQTLSKIKGEKVNVTFVPHLLPVNRGILATCYAKLVDKNISKETIISAYKETYKNEYFIRIMPEGKSPNIHNVKYTNFCDIGIFIDEENQMLIVISAIDNMVKGAAGQAIQNMNLAYGFDEKEGLAQVPPAF